MRIPHPFLLASPIFFLLTASALSARAQIMETPLLSFTGTGEPTPGASPAGTLISDGVGNLYGTTLRGGTFNAGVVFMLVKENDYAETVLHSFTGNAAGDGDGGFPAAGLVKGTNGNLYGTTPCGGDGACDSSGIGGDGIVYELSPAGSYTVYTVVYRFNGGSDGSRPSAPLIDVGGNLYGTTTHGGVGNCDDGIGIGCGTAFEFTTAGSEVVLYRFTGGADGGIPYAPLVHDKLGHLDGTTSIGGGPGNLGTIFSLHGSNHTEESVLYQFIGGADGGVPMAGLSVDSSNNLYGTATCGGIAGGGCAAGNGVVFELSSTGFQTLHVFGGSPDGADPVAGVILDAVGNLCGTTYLGGGGSPEMGTLFTLTKSSSYETELVYDFSGTPDGANPTAGLTFGPVSKTKQLCPTGEQAASRPPKNKGACNYVCGATQSGGAAGAGTVFNAE